MEDNTNNQTTSNSFIVSLLSITIVGLLGYIGYIYYTKDLRQKGEIRRDYIKKDDVSFEILPSYIQSNYISKLQYDNKLNDIDELKSRINQLKSINNVAQNSAKSIVVPKIVEIELEKRVEVPKIVEKRVEVPKIVEKIVEVPKIIEKIVEVPKIIEKIVEVEAKPIIIDKNRYVTYTCKTLKNGTVYISKE
jgi:hypothetical protein